MKRKVYWICAEEEILLMCKLGALGGSSSIRLHTQLFPEGESLVLKF
jgi:hypothetical protein